MRSIKRLCTAISLFAVCGCATTSPPPLAYLALEKPNGVIQTTKNQEMKKEFARGGWYFCNYNFRPSADLQSYLGQAQKEANATVLRNADIQLNVPFAFDILLFGYNHANDTVTLKAEVEAQL